MDSRLEYKECYQLLGVDSDCGWADLRAAYRRQVQIWHPDRYAENSAERGLADERIKQINLSYSRLARYYREHGILPAVPPERPITQPPLSEPPPDSATLQRERAFAARSEATSRPETRRFRPVALVLVLAVGYLLIWLSDSMTEKSRDAEPAAETKSRPPPSLTTAYTAKPGARFGMGSSKNEVIRVQGRPMKETDDVWDYGASRVYFRDNRVVGWHSSPFDPLKVRE